MSTTVTRMRTTLLLLTLATLLVACGEGASGGEAGGASREQVETSTTERAKEAIPLISEALEATRTAYYERYRFAELFAPVRRAPVTVMAEVRRVSGIAVAEDRISAGAILDVPGIVEPVTARIHSLPGADGLNRLVLRSGRLPRREGTSEVVINEAFATPSIMPGTEMPESFRAKPSTIAVIRPATAAGSCGMRSRMVRRRHGAHQNRKATKANTSGSIRVHTELVSTERLALSLRSTTVWNAPKPFSPTSASRRPRWV